MVPENRPPVEMTQILEILRGKARPPKVLQDSEAREGEEEVAAEEGKTTRPRSSQMKNSITSHEPAKLMSLNSARPMRNWP